jgi:hypothetical protein
LVFVFLFVLVFGFFPPLIRQWQNYFWDTISRIGGWGTNSKIIKTETLAFELGDFFFLSLSNECLAYCWLVHYLSLFISLVLFKVFFIVFPFIFTFFAFSLLSPSQSRYHHCYYYKLENT